MSRITRVFAKLSKKTKIILVALAVSIGAVGAAWPQSSEPLTPKANTSQIVAEPTPTPGVPYVLKIGKLSLSAPIIPNVPGTIEKEYLKAIENGVAHYAGTALPGNKGNAFIFGHSSYYKNKPGNYKEVFKELNKLVVGDQIEVVLPTETLVYEVKQSKIVADDDLSILAQGTDEMITIMTCWPPGTLAKRYVIQAQRVAATAPVPTASAKAVFAQ